MTTWISIDREFHSPENASISVFDHGFLFGDSVYEVVRTYGGVPFALEEHLRRLAYSASELSLPLPYPPAEIAEEVIRGIEKRGGETRVRIVVTRGTGDVNISPASCARPSMIAFFLPMTSYPPECYANGVHVALVDSHSRRIESGPQIKSGNYVKNVIGILEASRQGALEGAMCDSRGKLTECTTSNIFLVCGGIVLTPDLDSGILDGITRRKVLALVERLGFPLEVRPIDRAELLSADEIFITSTLKEIMPVRTIGLRPLPSPVPGKVTSALMRAFAEEVALFRQLFPDAQALRRSLSWLST